MRVSLPKRMALLPDRTLTKYRDDLLFNVRMTSGQFTIFEAAFKGRDLEYVSCYVKIYQAGVYSCIGSGFSQVIGRGHRAKSRSLSLALRSCGILPSDSLDTASTKKWETLLISIGEALGHDPRRLRVNSIK